MMYNILLMEDTNLKVQPMDNIPKILEDIHDNIFSTFPFYCVEPIYSCITVYPQFVSSIPKYYKDIINEALTFRSQKFQELFKQTTPQWN